MQAVPLGYGDTESGRAASASCAESSFSFVLLADCARSGTQSNKAVATVEEPPSHAWSNAPDGWWRDFSLGGKAPPYGLATRFEVDLQSAESGELSRGWRLPPDFS